MVGTAPDGETRELYAAMGWEFVDSMAGDLFIYRAIDPAAPPLHNDFSGLEKPMRHMRQKQLALAWVFLLMFLFTSVSRGFTGVLAGKGVDYVALINFGTGRALYTLLMLIVMLPISVIHFRRAALAKRILIKGELPPGSSDHRRRAIVAGLLLPLSILCAVSWFALKLGSPGVRRGWRIGEEDVLPFPQIYEISPEDGALLTAAIEADSRKYGNDIFRNKDLLAPVITEISQTLHEGAETGPQETVFNYRAACYETVSERVAEGLFDDLISSCAAENDLKGGAVTVSGADAAELYENSDGWQYLFLRADGIVWSVHNYGQGDLRRSLGLFTEYLKIFPTGG